jgi:hypothetical protein
MIIETDEIIQLLSSLLALFLFVISFLAYLRERRKKLLLLSAAFFFYSTIKFLDTANVFFPRTDEYFEILGSLLDFIVLALFFLSMIIKE